MMGKKVPVDRESSMKIEHTFTHGINLGVLTEKDRTDFYAMYPIEKEAFLELKTCIEILNSLLCICDYRLSQLRSPTSDITNEMYNHIYFCSFLGGSIHTLQKRTKKLDSYEKTETNRKEKEMLNYVEAKDEDVALVVKRLDPNNSDHWIANGKPALSAVNYFVREKYAGNANIYVTRKQVDRVLPNWGRKDAEYNQKRSVDETELVRFRIPKARLNDDYVTVLAETFNLNTSEIKDLADCYAKNVVKFNADDVVLFLCTKAQFGEFIINRSIAGLQNLIQELRVDKVGKKKRVSMSEVASRFKLSTNVVQAIVAIVEDFGYTRPENFEWLDDAHMYDVSER